MNSDFIRVHHFLPGSQANGPGLRAVIWVQGCSLACPGCFNPETHPFDGGESASVSHLFQRIRALESAELSRIEGVSISGGEPLQQMRPLLRLLECIKGETSLSVLVFTGYTWQEVSEMPEAGALSKWVDVMITGRYDAAQRLASGLRGSANQTVHLLTDRYTMDQIAAVPPAEVIITADGQAVFSGVDPVRFRWD